MDPQRYVAEIKAKLVSCPVIVLISIIEERILPDRGYFRARLALSNEDFLEVAEYFVIEGDRCIPRRYRYQWMDKAQQVLRKRWDNVEHFPDLPNFPHHVHVGEEAQVEPGKTLSIVELVDIVEQELSKPTS